MNFVLHSQMIPKKGLKVEVWYDGKCVAWGLYHKDTAAMLEVFTCEGYIGDNAMKVLALATRRYDWLDRMRRTDRSRDR